MNSLIEVLEQRIAPAVIIASNGLSASYTDVDGDSVTMKITTGDLNLAVFTMAAVGAGEHLQKVDFTAGGIGSASNITFAVKKSITGDGLANIGEIDATGFDLGTVTVKGDLTILRAGDNDGTTPGVKALKVDSLGVYDSTSFIQVKGDITSMQVKYDVVGAYIQTTSDGSLGTLTIGGSLIGGDTGITGCFLIDGDIGTVKIGGNIIGGSGASSGTIFADGNLGSLTIGGSIIGGAVVAAGQVEVDGIIGTIKIGGDIVGGNGAESGRISAASFSGAITVGGSLMGGSGADSGLIESESGNIADVKIGRNVIGGAGIASGSIISFIRMGNVTIGGALIGGSGDDSGIVSSDTQLGTVKIGGDLRGGSAALISGAVGTGAGKSSNSITSVSVGGSMIGGSGALSGVIFTTGSIDKGVKIARDFIGGSVNGTASLNATGLIEAEQDIFSVSIGGNVVSGIDDSTGSLTRSASIRAGGTLGAVAIKGSIVGSSTSEGDSKVVISAGYGPLPLGAGSAIKSLTVGGGVFLANIMAGYSVDLVAANGQVEIGAVKVGRDWVASNLVAGVQNITSSNTSFGNMNDSGIGGGTLSKIASVLIKGQVVGKDGGSEQFGFVARHIGSFKAAGYKAPLTSVTDGFIPLSAVTADVNIHEV